MSEKKNTGEGLLTWISMSVEPIPEFKLNKSKGYVEYGEDNSYPSRLLELFDRSTFHGAIIQGKADFISGSGIDYNKELPAAELRILEKFINNPNPLESLHDIIKKDALYLSLFGGLAHQIAWKLDKKGFNVYAKEFMDVRSNEDNTLFFTKQDWEDSREKPIELKAYNPKYRDGQQIHYSYFKRPGKRTYPVPDYINAMEAIVCDYLFVNFHKNNIENGFAAGTFIELPYGDDWPAEKKREFEKKLKRKSTGTDKAGGLLISFLNGVSSNRTQITPLQSNNIDKQFTVIDALMQQRIFTGHRITSPMLFGIKTEGQLGGRNEIMEAFEILHATQISPKQQYLERLYNDYAKVLGVSDPQIKIKKSQPLGLDILDLAEKQIISKSFAQKYVAEQLGVDISEIQEQSIPQQQQQMKFNSDCQGCEKWNDENDLKIFAQFGEVADDYEFGVEKKEIEVLNLIKDNPKVSTAEIADLLKLDLPEIKEILTTLRNENLLKLPDSGGGNMVITPEGDLAIENFGSDFRKIEVRYKYDKDPMSEGDNVLPTTRDFCREMVKMNRIYSRDDIDQISLLLGYDVWKRRGGWTTLKGSSPPVHIPHCRHVWRQTIVRRRINK